MPVPISIRPAAAIDAAALHRAFGAAFADYLAGPLSLPFEQWPGFLGRQAVDLPLSRVAQHGGEVRAFALVAPRPAACRWRLATMAALPEARGSGAAPALLDELIERARGAGVRALELEVFARNERAVRLYRGRGFEARHELHGYVGPGRPSPGVVPEPLDVGRDAAFEWLAEAEHVFPDLPLQVTPAGLTALTSPAADLQAWRLGSAQVMFCQTGADQLVIHSLIDRDPAQRDALALLQALRALHPGRPVRVPPLQRDDVGGAALRRAGFERLPLHQLWMLKAL